LKALGLPGSLGPAVNDENIFVVGSAYDEIKNPHRCSVQQHDRRAVPRRNAEGAATGCGRRAGSIAFSPRETRQRDDRS